MRLLLLAALFVRLAPAPALAATTAHCGEHGGEAHAAHAVGAAHAVHAEGAHAEDAANAEGEAHDDCPHCPPADCSKHDHCPQPGMVIVASDVRSEMPAAPLVAPRAPGTESLASRADPPPVRPPLSPLA